MPERITTAELLAALIEQQSRELLHALPGRIESYDAAKQRANIRLQLQYYMPDGLGGRVAKEHPVIMNVPIAFPQGGGFFCSFPLAQGDPVTVIFCDVPIGAWLQKGSVCEPGAEDRHTTAGAIAFPAGPQPSKSPLQSADASNMMLGKDGTDAAQIEITPTEIHLGKGASKGVARNGDGCDGGTLLFVPGAGGAALTYFPPGATVVGPGTSIPLSPKINQGSLKVKAED